MAGLYDVYNSGDALRRKYQRAAGLAGTLNENAPPILGPRPGVGLEASLNSLSSPQSRARIKGRDWEANQEAKKMELAERTSADQSALGWAKLDLDSRLGNKQADLDLKRQRFAWDQEKYGRMTPYQEGQLGLGEHRRQDTAEYRAAQTALARQQIKQQQAQFETSNTLKQAMQERGIEARDLSQAAEQAARMYGWRIQEGDDPETASKAAFGVLDMYSKVTGAKPGSTQAGGTAPAPGLMETITGALAPILAPFMPQAGATGSTGTPALSGATAPASAPVRPPTLQEEAAAAHPIDQYGGSVPDVNPLLVGRVRRQSGLGRGPLEPTQDYLGRVVNQPIMRESDRTAIDQSENARKLLQNMLLSGGMPKAPDIETLARNDLIYGYHRPEVQLQVPTPIITQDQVDNNATLTGSPYTKDWSGLMQPRPPVTTDQALAGIQANQAPGSWPNPVADAYQAEARTTSPYAVPQGQDAEDELRLIQMTKNLPDTLTPMMRDEIEKATKLRMQRNGESYAAARAAVLDFYLQNVGAG